MAGKVPMPKIIKQRIQSKEDTSKKVYQKYDYLIAARTGYFNLMRNNNTLILYSDGGNMIPISETILIPDLDPTLVKAIAMQESSLGVPRVKDLMTLITQKIMDQILYIKLNLVLKRRMF